MRKLLLTFALWASATTAGAMPPHQLLLLTSSSAPASYSGPGDVVTGATGFWGLRAYTAAIASAGTQKLINLRNGTTVETCDVLVASSGGLGLTANCSGSSSGESVSTFLGAATGYGVTIYDQVGSANMTQATTTKQPTLILSCIGGKPCLQFSGGQTLAGTLAAAADIPDTVSVVYERTGATTSTQSYFEGNTGAQVLANNAANQALLYNGSSMAVTGVNDNSPHALQALFNGGSSVANVDGAETTGNAGGNASGTSIAIGESPSGAQPATGYESEAGLWATTGFNSAQRTNMCHNQAAYYGISASC